MKQERMDAAMRRIGRTHELLCRIPVVGEPMSRGLSWLLAVFPMLGGMRKSGSIEQTREMLHASGEQMGFPFQISEIEGDHFVLELPYCPYGFTRADQQRACDTAMDMDRIMFRRCGAELTIEETIPGGASRCHMVIRQLG
jgi:hypothetical protein